MARVLSCREPVHPNGEIQDPVHALHLHLVYRSHAACGYAKIESDRSHHGKGVPVGIIPLALNR